MVSDDRTQGRAGWWTLTSTETVSEEQRPWSTAIRTNGSVKASPDGRSNAISSTKYSPLTWLPKSIWEQFRRLANVYFLLISVLQIIGRNSTFWSAITTYPRDVCYISLLNTFQCMEYSRCICFCSFDHELQGRLRGLSTGKVTLITYTFHRTFTTLGRTERTI